MSIGLKRGTVVLEDHSPEWDEEGARTVRLLSGLLGDAAEDVQHVGSTSVRTIKAKPIIDVAVAVRDYGAVLEKKGELEKHGVIFRLDERPEQLLFVMGDFAADTRTHHIHVVLADSPEWRGYIAFRDYLNSDPAAAARYEKEKLRLAARFPYDRDSYTQNKSAIVTELLKEAKERIKFTP